MEEKTYHVVAAIIKDGDKYLCMQRGRSHYAYISEHWEFPGGKVEAGESDHEALVREIKEEMDWDVFVGKKWVQWNSTIPISTCISRLTFAKAVTESSKCWNTWTTNGSPSISCKT